MTDFVFTRVEDMRHKTCKIYKKWVRIMLHRSFLAVVDPGDISCPFDRAWLLLLPLDGSGCGPFWYQQLGIEIEYRWRYCSLNFKGLITVGVVILFLAPTTVFVFSPVEDMIKRHKTCNINKKRVRITPHRSFWAVAVTGDISRPYDQAWLLLLPLDGGGSGPIWYQKLGIKIEYRWR